MVRDMDDLIGFAGYCPNKSLGLFFLFYLTVLSNQGSAISGLTAEIESTQRQLVIRIWRLG
jgi:hypothetical protein